MNVTEDMETGLDAPDLTEQVRAAVAEVTVVFLRQVGVFSGGYEASTMRLEVMVTTCTYWRTVGHEYVRLRRNSTEPGLSGRCVLKARGGRPYQRSGITDSERAGVLRDAAGWAALWNVGGAKDGQTAAFDFLHRQLALEIEQAVQVKAVARADIVVGVSAGIEEAIVVTGDNHLDLVRQALEPVELLLDGVRGAAVGEVAGMDKDVAGGDLDKVVVRVGDADDAYGRLVARRLERGAAEDEEEAVEERDEEGEGREYVVDEGEAIEGIAAAEAEADEQAHVLSKPSFTVSLVEESRWLMGPGRGCSWAS